MSDPLISVIIPVYRVEKYLDECVRSVVDQTYTNLEIILVDDGSPDNCPQMCDEWAKKDKRIKVIHKENGGASTARNAALDIAKGEYIGFVDSDDFIEKGMYEALLYSMQKGNCFISCCYTVRISANGDLCEKRIKGTKQKRYIKREAINAFLQGREISSSMCDKLFSQHLWEKIRFPEKETNEEYTIWIPLLEKTNGIIHVGEQLYYYRGTEGSVTHSTWKTDADIVLKHLREMQEQMYGYNLTESIRAFQLFSAKAAYSTALHLDKNYERINAKAQMNQKEYIKIMRKHFWKYQVSRYTGIKDKILYFMIATRTLRPVYKLLGRL